MNFKPEHVSLQGTVLVCIAISLLCTTLLLGFIESWTPFYPANRVPHLTRRHSSYFHSFRLIYGALFAQATDDHLPRSLSGRLLVSGWWLFSIVVAATYSGNLVAFFTVTKTKPLFYTLHDLLAQDTYKIGFMGGSAIHHTVKVSSSHLHSSLWSKVSGWLQEDPAYLTTNISVHRARLMAGEYALIADKTTLEGWAKQDCSLELTRETFLPIEYGVGLPNDSAFTRLFSQKGDNQNHLPKEDNQKHLPKEDNQKHLPKEDNQKHLPKEDNQKHLPKEDNQKHLPKEDNQKHLPKKTYRLLVC
ncbi:hypothetical protein ACOMHN_047434 [Nucella lapillus]